MATNLHLTFASGEDSFSVRRFLVHDALSQLFRISLLTRSPRADIDFESLIGRGAAFGLRAGVEATWSGIVSHVEVVGSEPDGLSTYALTIVPELWLLTQRTNHRIFQRLNAVEIAEKLLADWNIAPVLKLERATFPKYEMRIQYGESDFEFLSRILEEAGITYFFTRLEDVTRLVFTDAPQAAEPRSGALPFVGTLTRESRQPHVTNVSVARDVRPGRVALRDFDFQRRPDYELRGIGLSGHAIEGRLERYHYRPGAFVVEPKVEEKKLPALPVAGVGWRFAGADEAFGKSRATGELDAHRAGRRRVTFETNTLDLPPGTVFGLKGHPREELAAEGGVLVVDRAIAGGHDDEWSISATAHFASEPWRSPHSTPKPQLFGLQSAIIVGPPGEEIHTDPYGRVKVQFHWDREGRRNEESSCWMRVAQGWAGLGYGMFALPRVGHEVIVAFFEGDPDQPLVIGSVHNSMTRPPYDLPAAATVSTWRSDSTPGSGGFNEIRFDDKKGSELVYLQAERTFEKLVKRDETESTGGNRTVSVAQNRATTIGAVDESTVGARHAVTMVPFGESRETTTFEMVDRRIHFTTGEASITLDGPNITLMAKGVIKIKSTDHDVEIEGGPWVKINCGAEGELENDTYTMHHVTGVLRDQDGEPLADRRVIVKGSDGAVQIVQTDGKGKYFALVPPGECQVSLTDNLRYGRAGSKVDDMTYDPESFEDCGPAV